MRRIVIPYRQGLSASSSYLDELVEELLSDCTAAEIFLEGWLSSKDFEQLEELMISVFWLCQKCRDCMTRFGSEGGQEQTIKSLEEGLQRFDDIVSKLLDNASDETKKTAVVFNQNEDSLGDQLLEFQAHTADRFDRLEDGIEWLNQKRIMAESSNLWPQQSQKDPDILSSSPPKG